MKAAIASDETRSLTELPAEWFQKYLKNLMHSDPSVPSSVATVASRPVIPPSAWRCGFLLHHFSVVLHCLSPLLNTTRCGAQHSVRAKLHYTDTGYEHRLRSTDTTNGRAHNNSTTNLSHRNARAQHLGMLRCWDVTNFCPLVVFIAGVPSRCPRSGVWL